MAIKAESVEQFSLEVIFPSSNYEAAMPKLHRHVTAAEVLEESFLHWCLHAEHNSRKKKQEKWSNGESHGLGS